MMTKLLQSYALHQRTGKRAFTLIELVVVIAILLILVGLLIVAVMAMMSESQDTKTRSTLEQIKTSISEMENKGQIGFLVQPQVGTRDCTAEFINAVKGNSPSYTSLDDMQRATLLAFYIAPSQAQFDKIIDKGKLGTRAAAHEPLISEGIAKAFLRQNDDGFNYLADAWDYPITYEFIASSQGSAVGGADTSMPWVLISGGEDGVKGTEDDLWLASNGNQGGGTDWEDAFK